MPFSDTLARIPVAARLMGAAGTAFSSLLLPEQLIPENLTVIVPITALLIAIAVFVSVAFRNQAKDWKRYLTFGLVFGFLTITAMQLTLVESVAAYGSPKDPTHRFLTGFSLTADGGAMADLVGNPRTRAQFIRDIGDESIPQAWGWSYYAAAILYTLGYGTLAFCFVVGVAALEAPAPQETLP